MKAVTRCALVLLAAACQPKKPSSPAQRPEPAPDAAAWYLAENRDTGRMPALDEQGPVEVCGQRMPRNANELRCRFGSTGIELEQLGELTQLQSWAESLHANAGVNGVSFGPPSSGTLATIHATALVAPPTGLEAGYVPIVIRQY